MANEKNVRKLSKRTVDALENHTAKPERVWDSLLKGFSVNAYKSGRKVYYACYRLRGSRQYHWYNIGQHGSPWTPETARDEAKRILGIASSGIDPKAEMRQAREDEAENALTVAHTIDRYLSEGPIDKPDKRASSWNNDRGYLNNHARVLLGNHKIADLQPTDISNFQNDVLNGKSAAKARKKLNGKKRRIAGGNGAAVHAVRSLSACLGWAVSRDLLSDNPCNKINKLQDGVRERYLSSDEATRLFAAIDDLLEEGAITQQSVDCLTVISFSAARASEILGMRWSEVDFDRRLLILPPLRHKTGGMNKPKALPLVTSISEILQRRYDDPDKDDIFVFPSSQSRTGHQMTVKHAFAKIVKRAELADFRVHDYRNAYASFAINAGQSLKTIGENLGHKKASTTERYAHLLVETRRPVAEGVEAIYKNAKSKTQSPAP